MPDGFANISFLSVVSFSHLFSSAFSHLCASLATERISLGLYRLPRTCLLRLISASAFCQYPRDFLDIRFHKYFGQLHPEAVKVLLAEMIVFAFKVVFKNSDARVERQSLEHEQSPTDLRLFVKRVYHLKPSLVRVPIDKD